MIDLHTTRTPAALKAKLEQLWALSAEKITSIAQTVDAAHGAPVYTVDGQYTARGWTEWTQGFVYGSALIQFDATDDPKFLKLGRTGTRAHMPAHVTHFGVHDHGFNNVSTFGALLRLMHEGRIPANEWERAYYELALKCSGAVQARRWTPLHGGGGYIYSFNGPHSLFSDTIRSLRALAVAHQLGHVLMDEHDERVSLLGRLVQHALATVRYNVYYGEGRDGYDVRGRVVHESIFNLNDGRYRNPSTQQGFSPFTTWTRGLAWVMCGCAELLEFLETCTEEALAAWGGRGAIETALRRAAEATSDFYIQHTPTCGVPYWDTGAPNLHRLGDVTRQKADPFNPWEPVDSSAAAIAAQGLLRLGTYLESRDPEPAHRYTQAGLKVLDTLLSEPYLSTDPGHQGLLLHGVYHWPNRWDTVPEGSRVAQGESVMWGDYHLREAALYLQRRIEGQPYLRFFLNT